MSARLTALLHEHVERHGAGQVCSPVDVVLDKDGGHVVQPDTVFISHARLAIVNERVCGAPDLVIEILSPSTAHYNRTIKLAWYRKYGVRECWLADPRAWTIEVIELESAAPGRLFAAAEPIRSYVLGPCTMSSNRIFA